MKEVVITSKVVGREGAGVPAKIGQGSTVDLSAYLLKAIWDKVWEIRTDSTGQEYIFGKLPVVTQYGITMYAGDGGDIDLPSLYAGLPIDNTTIYWENGVLKAVGSSGGGGVADSVAWASVYGKPSWITDTKPTYAYSEITGTPDLTKYALKTDIPSLSGYATESWVIGKGYALDADLKTLATIVDDKADKTELAKYIPISGYTEVSGEKNFVGGLKVNGSPIVYDTEKKYWKLEGDLLVTGGVTMYANEGTYTPSTIMDALLYDDTTLGINSEGKLYVKGGTGGGLDITALQNYLTQNSYLNVTEGDGRYLKLSGGILEGWVGLPIGTAIYDGNEGGQTLLELTSNGAILHVGGNISATRLRGSSLTYYDSIILHASNYSSYALPLGGGVLTGSIAVESNGVASIRLTSGSSSYDSWLYFSDKSSTDLYSHAIGMRRPISSYGLTYKENDNYYKIWHSGNLTASSLGLGNVTNLAASGYLTALSSNTTNAVSITVGGTTKNITAATMKSSLGLGSNAYTSTAYLPSASYTASDVLAKLLTVDGSGSGLDADLLDGYHADFEQNANTVPLRNASGLIKVVGIYSNENSLAKDEAPYVFGGDTAHIAVRDIYNYNMVGSNNYGCVLDIQPRTNHWHKQLFFDSYGNTMYVRGASYKSTTWDYGWQQLAFITDNVASATKLQTARTIWGQSFDGTANIEGIFRSIGNYGTSEKVVHSILSSKDAPYGLITSIAPNGMVSLQARREANTSEVFALLLNPLGGNVGIGTTSPSQKLHVVGNIWSSGDVGAGAKIHAYGDIIANGNIGVGIENPSYKLHVISSTSPVCVFDSTYTAYGYNYGVIHLRLNGESKGAFGVNTVPSSLGNSNTAGTYIQNLVSGEWMNFYNEGGVFLKANLLVNGGVTFYSQKSLKNIQDERGLSLEEMSIIKPTRYTWKDGRDNRIHFGGIADDIQQVLPEVVYKTSEGILTMDYGNAAFAVASSLIKPVISHEAKITILQQRIEELEEEVERLKSA